ncbi:AAA-domain-containing protein [Lentinus tigrinus ALCF2SS1-7]|uniref:AAA-domain-containing protein n=1 Tax=Lentinus tigrinus ALCF2SS1-6 TaxID=1328759 RepID=A0A5C2ST58_9APHY|nr:AAA-domain-containing protein [Lentinus tigrinus ALCF2SS1-6]RPD80191.1 AAA-domain-containing protein [Lentinus tigrinus ALCF2SS1-7]
MRSHLLARRTRSLVKTLPNYHRAPISSTQALRYPRKDRVPSQSTPRLTRRAISSEPPISEPQEASASAPPPPQDPPPNADPPPLEDAEEKPKRRGRAPSVSVKETENIQLPVLPAGLKILWTPEDGSNDTAPSSSPNTTLPPPEIFDEALHNLHIALNPQTQHRATYSSGTGPLVEPTLALYCPIEGGDCILDETVREMARQMGADVVVLDAVQLAAGECGHFGKAASALQLPHNPLHFPSSSSRDTHRPMNGRDGEEEDEEPPQPFFMSPIVHVMTATPRRTTRIEAAPRSTPMIKLKSFFDEVINISPPRPQAGIAEELPPIPLRRPRIIYIKDYPTLAPSSSVWYPALLAAVRQRRQGALTRTTSPVANPTAIVFGISPSFMVPEGASRAPSPSMQGNNLTSSRSIGSSGSTALKSQNEYGEDSSSEKAREKRIQRRLKRWARGNAEDLPRLFAASEESTEGDGSTGRPNVVVLGQEGFSGLSPFLGSAFSRALAGRSYGSPGSDNRLGFYRTSLIFPTVRSLPQEHESRMARRREVNELVMRMGVAQVGGVLGQLEDVPDAVEESTEGGEHDKTRAQLWEYWGRTVEVWPNVQRIADRAVGSVMAASGAHLPSNRSLDPTPVPWSAVFDAWAADRSTQDLWKTLFATPPSGKLPRENEEEERAEVEDEADADEIIEKLRRNPDLDEHEQRLLGCIVDTASITTTFNQVHLPPHTIDSIRTMVSLPLLHPGAFQHGILKEHSMTGCLLFGPPGTGKTLVVRALAKEAGCRMLVVSPSDIMDMYVGEGEKLVRAVFSLARRLSPCVVFIDELDALFGARLSRESGNSLAHRGVITEFMQEMDGLKSSKESNVIVIGATNRPFDLDDAVLRRLPRRLLVDLPGEKEREEILKILLRDETLADDVDLKQLAKKTESFSGSDLKHLCVSAALDAVKERVTVPWRQTTATSPTPPIADEVKPVEDGPESQSSSEPLEAHGSTGGASVTPENAAREQPASTATTGTASAASTSQEPSAEISHVRSLAWRNFEQALKEITPSASESLGSLAELRKWNDEFGEGRRTKKRQVWGKDRFGFTVPALEIAPSEGKIEPGIVTPVSPPSNPAS